jgi:hypothetical protein
VKKIKCVVFFDVLGEFKREKRTCLDCWNVWARKYPHTAEHVVWQFTDNQTRLLDELIPGADFVFFDYGGLCMPGHADLGLSFARELEKQVVDHPTIEFILLCTMRKEWYEDNYLDQHVNLYFEDVDWFYLFSAYLGGIDA